MGEFVKQVERSFAIIGVPLMVGYAATLGLWWLPRRHKGFKQWCGEQAERFGLSPSLRTKRFVVWLMLALAALAYAYCTFCGKSVEEKAGHDAAFSHILVTFSIRVLPYFVLGCVLSAAIQKYVSKDSRWMPKSMLGAGTFGALLPICSCAAVPFSYSLMHSKRIRLRGVIMFMMVAPVLNPFVISFSWGMLGWQYTVLRIVSIFVLAMVTGTLIEMFVGQREPELPAGECFSCKGCSSSDAKRNADAGIVEGSYDLMAFLAPYMIIGSIIGAVFTVYVPTFIVGEYLSSQFMGLVLAAGIGLPLFLCSGEDVLILKPLMAMGLPMGHAIALTMAGNGICVSSIALLYPLFGKKATWWLIGAFFFGSIGIGLLINMVAPLLRL